MSAVRSGLSPNELRTKLHRGLILEYLSLGWMSLESTISIFAGLAAGSLALVAFGGDSFVELVSAYSVAQYLRKREKGNDDPAVLRRTERVTGALLVALIPLIALGAAYSFFTGAKAEASILGIGVATGAVAIMPFLWLGKRRIGRETRCMPLCIDAIESATCFFMSIALLAGLLAISLLGLSWVDYLATGIILAFISREAIETLRETEESSVSE